MVSALVRAVAGVKPNRSSTAEPAMTVGKTIRLERDETFPASTVSKLQLKSSASRMDCMPATQLNSKAIQFTNILKWTETFGVPTR